MKIKELSDATGISRDTIRFYEKTGVLPKAKKEKNGYRRYPAESVVQLKMISRAKVLGFTLNEIKDLARMMTSRNLTPIEMGKRLKKKNLEIDQKIEALQNIKKEINHALIGLCEFRESLK
jgi:DNA-binding transcriptional MerR regulator